MANQTIGDIPLEKAHPIGADTIEIWDSEASPGSRTKESPIAGVRRAAVINETTTARTLALTDEGHLVVDNGASVAITIDPVATTAYPVGWSTRLFQKGAGVVTVVADTNLNDSPVIINGEAGGSVALSAQYGQAYLAHVASNVWLIAGDVDAVQPGGAAASFLLDDVPGAAFAHATYKLRSAYAGACWRIRSGAGGEQDVGFNGNGRLDVAAAESFLAGNNGFLVTWYDQSGNSLDLTQASESAQPQVATSGTIATGAASRATVPVTGTRALARASVGAAAVGSTIGHLFVVGKQDTDTGNGAFVLWNAGATRIQLLSLASGGNLAYDHPDTSTGRLSAAKPGGWLTNYHLIEAFRSGASRELRVDGSSIGSAGGGSTASLSGTASLEISALSVNQLPGAIHAAILWPTDETASRATIESSLNGEYFP